MEQLERGDEVTVSWPDGRDRTAYVISTRDVDLAVRPGHVSVYVMGAGAYQLPTERVRRKED